MSRYSLIYTALLLMAFACGKPAGDDPVPEHPEEAPFEQEIGPLDEARQDATTPALLASGVVLPRAFAPCLHSDLLSIPMQGYKEGYALVFTDGAGAQYSARISTYAGGKLSFRLPEGLVSGEYRLSLISGNYSQDLGTRFVLCDVTSGTPGINVTGTVRISGLPAPGVVLSDGFTFSVTDADGRYNMISDKSNGYVFVRVPGNAAAKVDRAIPKFFVRFASSDTAVKETADFDLDERDNTRHRIFLMTDIHISDSYLGEIPSCNSLYVPDLEASIAATTVPYYMFTAGDQTTDSRWKAYNFDLTHWREFIAGWPIAIYHCMGNHDNDPSFVSSDWKAESTYKKIIGPSWYSLDIGKVHYVVLDNIIYENSSVTGTYGYYVRIAPYQLEYLRHDLSMVSPDTPVVFVSHSSLYILSGLRSVKPHYETQRDVDDLLDCFDGFREVHLISGHTHVNHNMMVRNGMYEHNMAASSASTWYSEYATHTAMHVCRDGTKGGYQIWDVDGTSLSWVHKAMGHSIDDSQFHLVELNNVPEDQRGTTDPDCVLVNVYNWDDAWSLQVLESGVPLTPHQVYMNDPVYKMVFPSHIGGQTIPARTDHLFMVQTSGPDTELEIIVTDRFGNRYTKTIQRPYAFTLENYI